MNDQEPGPADLEAQRRWKRAQPGHLVHVCRGRCSIRAVAPKKTPGEAPRRPAKARCPATPRGKASTPSQRIDKDKLRARLRVIGDEYVFYMLDDAIDLLPDGKLVSLVKKYIQLDDLRPDTVEGISLLDRVRRFETESLAGKYYQAFDVNSKNCMNQSAGTTSWISTFRRLLDECALAARRGDRAEVLQSFDILFGLLDTIDEFRVEIIFFADEGGSWQVGVDWDRVLPSWFAVLAATAEPEEYAQRVGTLVNRHCGYKRDDVIALAARAATSEQRAALAALPAENHRRR